MTSQLTSFGMPLACKLLCTVRQNPVLAEEEADHRQPEEEGIWRRPTVDRQLGSSFKPALVNFRSVLKHFVCGVDLTWKQLCNPDSCRSFTTLLQVCFELSGGSRLSGKAYTTVWGRFKVSHFNVWASTATLSGATAKKATMDTANNHQNQDFTAVCQLKIHSDTRVVLKGPEAFKLHAASRINSSPGRGKLTLQSS